MQDTINNYFSSYLKTNLRDKSGIKKALRLLEGYFKLVDIHYIQELKELQGFKIYLKEVKNIHGEIYNKGTIKKYLYLIRRWLTWLVKSKGFTCINASLTELENIISSYRIDKKKIAVEITEDEKKLLNDFIEYERLKGSRLYKEIKYRMKIFFRYVREHDIEIKRLTFRDAQDYQGYLATLTDEEGKIIYNPGTVARRMLFVKNFYGYLSKMKLIYSNPFDLVKRIKSNKSLPKDLPDEEKLLKLLTYFKEFWKQDELDVQKRFYKMHVISELMYASGLRIGEVSKLEEKDIDFERRIIVVREGKGGKDRIAYLNEYAGKVLELYIEKMSQTVNYRGRKKVIFGDKREAVLRKFINRNLRRYIPLFKIKNFTSHSFRHCLGYHLLKRGCGIRYIQLILGHEKLRSTEVYTKVDKESLKNQLDTCHPRSFHDFNVIEGLN